MSKNVNNDISKDSPIQQGYEVCLKGTNKFWQTLSFPGRFVISWVLQNLASPPYQTLWSLNHFAVAKNKILLVTFCSWQASFLSWDLSIPNWSLRHHEVIRTVNNSPLRINASSIKCESGGSRSLIESRWREDLEPSKVHLESLRKPKPRMNAEEYTEA